MIKIGKALSPVAAVITIALALLIPYNAHAVGTAQLYGEAGGTYFVRLTTLQEIRYRQSFRTTIRQQYDFSCGSAALATLLTYQYQNPVSEATVFQAMYTSGDQAKIRLRGFSLLDIKRYLEEHGYQADGFEANLDQLAEAHVPAIAMIRENGYNHFVVIKGIYDGKVLLGDPSAGTRIVSRPDFEAVWVEKILFLVTNHQDLAQFNEPSDWGIRLRAPLAQAISRDTLPGLMFPTRNDF